MCGPILVVDDDLPSLEWVAEALRDAGYEPVTAKNGAEALRVLASMERPPALVLLDLMMPVMNGWDVIATLVRFPKRPKVVVMSAYCKGDAPAGAHAILEKPLDYDAIVKTVRSFCSHAA